MIIRNTTDIPDKLIAIAYAFGAQENIVIDELIVKNKKKGKVHGQWGWYIAAHRKIIIIVPRVIDMTYHGRKPFTKLPSVISNRAEFLVSVLAHELRHAYQDQVLGWNMYDKSRPNLVKLESDAEKYEYALLAEWKREFGALAKVASTMK